MRDVVDVALDLLIDGERGVWHVADGATLSPYALARQVAAVAALPGALIEPMSRDDVALATAGPRYAALTSERGVLLTSLERALERWVHEAGSAPECIRPGPRPHWPTILNRLSPSSFRGLPRWECPSISPPIWATPSGTYHGNTRCNAGR